MQLVNAILPVYTWLAGAAMAVFLFLIARFYEKKSAQPTHSWAFGAPAALFVLLALLVLIRGAGVNDELMNVLLFLAGGLLILLGGFLLRLMMGGRQ